MNKEDLCYFEKNTKMFIYILYFRIKENKDWFLGKRNRRKVESGKNVRSTYKNLKHKVDKDFTSQFRSETERK